MTDTAKAITFAQHCLKWTNAILRPDAQGPVIAAPEGIFNPDSATDLERVLTQFLAGKYFIQINRGTTSLFQWRVMVGLQDLTGKDASWEEAIGVGDDLWDAIFDACVTAAGMFEKSEQQEEGSEG